MHMLVFALLFERHAIPCTPCFPCADPGFFSSGGGGGGGGGGGERGGGGGWGGIRVNLTKKP